MRNFRELKVWEKAHELTLGIYEASSKFPREEIYGLTSQLRRASSSIPSNIAEGCGKSGNADFSRFLEIALGSACEVEYQLLLSKDLGYFGESVYQDLNRITVDIKKMLTVFLKKLRVNMLTPDT